MNDPLRCYAFTAGRHTQIQRAFHYRPPAGNQVKRYEALRSAAQKLAYDIVYMTPNSREQSIALTKLEEVIMFANAAIARNEFWDGNRMTNTQCPDETPPEPQA